MINCKPVQQIPAPKTVRQTSSGSLIFVSLRLSGSQISCYWCNFIYPKLVHVNRCRFTPVWKILILLMYSVPEMTKLIHTTQTTFLVIKMKQSRLSSRQKFFGPSLLIPLFLLQLQTSHKVTYSARKIGMWQTSTKLVQMHSSCTSQFYSPFK